MRPSSFVRLGQISLGQFSDPRRPAAFQVSRVRRLAVPAWIPGSAVWWSQVAGVALIVGGLGLLFRRTAALAASADRAHDLLVVLDRASATRSHERQRRDRALRSAGGVGDRAGRGGSTRPSACLTFVVHRDNGRRRRDRSEASIPHGASLLRGSGEAPFALLEVIRAGHGVQAATVRVGDGRRRDGEGVQRVPSALQPHLRRKEGCADDGRWLGDADDR